MRHMSGRAFKIHGWLMPAAWIYRAVTSVRNRMYDNGTLPAYSAPFPVISVGNITAGGTGKTPHCEYLAKLLQNRFKTAVLSRGYGRKTKGFLMIGSTTTPSQAGDEPCQMAGKFTDTAFAVCEKRETGLKMLQASVSPEVVILDDAFQHRSVTPSLNILLVNRNRNIMQDKVLPAGLLREGADGRKRADIIIVSKCPQDISPEERLTLTRELCPDNDGRKVFFTTLEYANLTPFNGNGTARSLDSITSSTHVTVATGIASPEPILQELRNRTGLLTSVRFPDHHDYSAADVRRISKAAESASCSDSIVVITEKDAIKLRGLDIDSRLAAKIFVLPVEVRFIGGREDFDSLIFNHINNFKAKL